MSPYARRVYATTLLMVTGFAFLSRLTQIAPPSTRFVYLGAGVCLGFLPTPPHDDAVASGSQLAPPLPPGDFHPQSIAHAGRTQARHSRRRMSALSQLRYLVCRCPLLGQVLAWAGPGERL